MSSLLDAHQHDYQNHIGRARAAPRPRQLRLAESYIARHLDRPLTVEDVAAAAGISPRGLQMIFRKDRGTTPLAYWRDLRLARAHEDLASGLGSVTDVALKWGFAHFGRFAQSYRARYGLTPRETAQAAREVGYRD
jgi:transcriptional regulator GlxA family with amidase domain